MRNKFWEFRKKYGLNVSNESIKEIRKQKIRLEEPEEIIEQEECPTFDSIRFNKSFQQ